MLMAREYAPYTGPTITRAEAKTAGLTRFFTGKPCKHGHLSERTSANGGCIQCNAMTCADLYKHETRAARAERNARGKAWKAENREQVRAAGREYSKTHREQANAWKAANRDAINAAEREARKRNPEAYKAITDRYLAKPESKARQQAYYKANAETIKQRVREYAAQNPDAVRETSQAWYRANIEAAKQRTREWNAANPEAARAHSRNYRARKNEAEGSHTAADIKVLYAAQGGRCIYCRTKLGENYQVDHIQALSRGGTNDRRNLQLTCAPCNNRKRATDPIAFAQRMGLLL